MRRREFVALAGGAAAAWPLAARAQQRPAVPVVGFLSTTSRIEILLNAFRRGLAEAGFIEGRNLAIEYRFAEGNNDRLLELAAELVTRRVAVIVTNGGTGALPAKAATATIPIVFASGVDPVKLGLVASLNRPGGNLTGIFQFTQVLVPKRLELLRELVPRPGVIAQLVHADDIAAETEVSDLQEAARSVGQQINVVRVRREGDLDSAFSTVVQQSARALVMGSGPFLNSRRSQIVALATRHMIPTMYTFREFVAGGGLVSYATSGADVQRQLGIYAGRILKGDKPADLPVMQPTRFELVVNLKAAKAIGLTISETFLVRADEVIE